MKMKIKKGEEDEAAACRFTAIAKIDRYARDACDLHINRLRLESADAAHLNCSNYSAKHMQKSKK